MEPFPEDLFTIPGDPRAIAESGEGYRRYAATLGEVRAGIATATAPRWVGVEGDLYRSRLAEFPPYLSAAEHAFGEVACALTAFAAEVAAAQRAMDAERAAARAAWARLRSASAGPTPAASSPGPGSVADLEFDGLVRRAATLRAQVEGAAHAAQARIGAVSGAAIPPPPVSERFDSAAFHHALAVDLERRSPPEWDLYTDARSVVVSGEAGAGVLAQGDVSYRREVLPDGRVALTLLVGQGVVTGVGVGAMVKVMFDDTAYGGGATASAEVGRHARSGVVLILSAVEARRLTEQGDVSVLMDGLRPRRPDGIVVENEVKGSAGAEVVSTRSWPAGSRLGTVGASAEASAANRHTQRRMTDGTIVDTITADVSLEGQEKALMMVPDLRRSPGLAIRSAEAQGRASGRGTIEITRADGAVTRLTLRVRATAQGSTDVKRADADDAQPPAGAPEVEWEYTLPVDRLPTSLRNLARSNPAALLHDPRLREQAFGAGTVTRKEIEIDSSTTGGTFDAEFIAKANGEAGVTTTSEKVKTAEYWDGMRFVAVPRR